MTRTTSTLLLALLCVACSPQKAPPALETNTDALRIALETSAPVCSLNITDLALKNDIEKNLKNYKSLPDSNYGETLSKQYRLYALRRLHSAFQTGENTSTFSKTANIYYKEFRVPPLGKSFEDALPAYEYIDNLVKIKHRRTDTNSADYNIRFCVINDLSSSVRGTIRKRFKGGIASGEIKANFIPQSSFYKFIKGNRFATSLAKNLMSEAWPAAQSRAEDQVALALLRTRTTAIFPSEPKTAKAFWDARNLEMTAIQNHISTHNYETIAKQLADMATYEQTARHLFLNPALNIAHFGSKTEADLFAKSIGKYMGKADSFNTNILKAHLTSRTWINDAVDGNGAAHDAWLIAQHADKDRDFQRDVLARMKTVMDEGWVSKSNYAYLYDRVASGESRPQRYATQGRCVATGKWEPNEMEEPDKIDERRAEMELVSLSTYKSRFKDSCFVDEK